MSRCHEWNSKLEGLTNWVIRYGLIIDVRGVKGKSDKYMFVEMRKIVNQYSSYAGLKGSYSERILNIKFPDFVQFMKTTNWPQYGIESKINSKPSPGRKAAL